MKYADSSAGEIAACDLCNGVDSSRSLDGKHHAGTAILNACVPAPLGGLGGLCSIEIVKNLVENFVVQPKAVCTALVAIVCGLLRLSGHGSSFKMAIHTCVLRILAEGKRSISAAKSEIIVIGIVLSFQDGVHAFVCRYLLHTAVNSLSSWADSVHAMVIEMTADAARAF